MGHPISHLPWALPDKVKSRLPNGNELLIRGVNSSDMPELSQIYVRAYEKNGADEKWTPGSAHKLLESLHHTKPGLSLVAEIDGKIVGATFGNIRPWESGKVILEGKELFVDPNYQKLGIGNELLKERIHRAEVWSGANEVEIITFATTREPKGWYERLGYKPVTELQIMSGETSEIKKRLS